MDRKNKKKDYVIRLDKIRMSREKKDNKKYYIAGGIGLFLVTGVFASISFMKGNESKTQVTPVAVEADVNANQDQETLKNSEEIKKVLDSYENLGIVKVSSYLNIRETPSTDGDVVGKLQGDGACDILEETEDGWYKITSGGVEGYIHSKYVVTGEDAIKQAEDLVKLRAVVKADSLNIRKEPSKSSESVGQVLSDERYEVEEELDGWVKISSGYLSSEYVSLEYSFNEARKLDMKAMVFNYYKNLGISNVDNYLNVREEPNENGKIIAKMPSKAAGDILETVEGGWYKIQSGSITGYVKADYILTGPPAKDEAMKVAQLMAIVNADTLNARTEPSTDAKIWTQISNNEKYPVLQQIDGWIEIELEEDSSAYVSTDFVDVRYALPQAIKFSPLEEKANSQSSLRTKIVNYALQFLGNPYVWGGTSLTNGTDCSGFTLSVFAHFGIKLPHYSGSQANMGTAVTSSEMKPGDLLFYANSRGIINHVAMYIGNGQVVHAATSRTGIKISTWNYRSPVRIRNIIGN